MDVALCLYCTIHITQTSSVWAMISDTLHGAHQWPQTPPLQQHTTAVISLISAISFCCVGGLQGSAWMKLQSRTTVSKQMTSTEYISSFSSFESFWITSLSATFHWFTLLAHLEDGYFATKVIQRKCKLESQNYCIHWKMIKTYSLIDDFPISF